MSVGDRQFTIIFLDARLGFNATWADRVQIARPIFPGSREDHFQPRFFVV